ncbi:hypothetical protein E2562_016893 [Oryza meyeriana var. granulata]|uniref:Uncharacterized protein n=1 Tax=Oryza meyeriana var. granulata TaxID=110450 RepID=A0A6G1DXF9_9ORYZ|nr:hypothetical protein E2562_016893 [Oryza meyeriana var. granulata]
MSYGDGCFAIRADRGIIEYASESEMGAERIKRIPYKHRCASTSKLENNCMASNSWVKNRVINKLRTDPTIGAGALKKSLEEKYCIKLSYYVVWDGRQMALDEILGGL